MRLGQALGPVLLSTLLAFSLTGCSNDDDNDSAADNPVEETPDNQTPDEQDPDTTAFTMQLLHFADVDGAGGADDVRNFSALVDGFRGEMPENTVLLSSGDNLIPGPEFFAAGADSMAAVLGEPGNGRAHIGWLNAIGVQASVVGNHDLDASPEDFAELLVPDGDWPGAQFPYLSANIDFTADSDVNDLGLVTDDGQAAQPNSLAGSATLTVDGETIGVVGASFPSLGGITNTGGLVITPDDFDSADPADLDALAAEIQPAVDALAEAGINKIIVLTHMQQIAIEKALATRLNNVDIIVAGGSNTLLADSNDRLRDGDTAADDYPLSFQSPEGEPVLVVNTAGDFKYLGRLIVGFDDQGVILPDSLDPGINGAWATDTISQPFNPDPVVDEITDALDAVILAKDGNVLGLTDVYLDGRRSQVRTEETNLGNLTSRANLWLAQQQDSSVEVAIKNGGGIRADIGQVLQPPGSTDPSEFEFLPPTENPDVGKPQGGISQLDLETSLRFNNGLVMVTVTPAELADLLEHAFHEVADGATPGSFPQIAGMQVIFDPSETARPVDDTNQAPGMTNRVRELEVLDQNGQVVKDVVSNGVINNSVGNIRLVTLSFLANDCVADSAVDCGDEYPFKGLAAPNKASVITDPGQSDFSDAGREQDALAEFLLDQFPVGGTPFNKPETDPANDQRIVNLAVQSP